MCTALWQRKRPQCCNSDGADSNVTVLGHQWLWHRCDSDVYISVTAMATDTAVTAVATDSAVLAVAAMCTLMWQLLSVATTFTVMCTSLSHQCTHRCHTNVNITVTALSVVTALTLVCTVVLQQARRQGGGFAGCARTYPRAKKIRLMGS